MARRSEQLILTEEERAELEKLKGESNKTIALRASIIIACADENENKKVAEKLGTSACNVGHWKEAFRKDRVRAIAESREAGWPRNGAKPKIVPEQIREYIDAHPDTWNAGGLSEEFNITLSDVYRALEKLGIRPNQRMRRWTHTTADTLIESRHMVIGLLLLPGSKTMMIAEMPEEIEAGRVQGELTTSNSKLYKLLEGSKTELSLSDSVITYAKQAGMVSHGNYPLPVEFLQEVETLWEKESVTRIDVFSHGDESVLSAFQDKSTEKVCIHEGSSYTDWYGQISVWGGNNCGDEERAYLSTLLDVISEYDKALEKGVEAFVWRLHSGVEKIENRHPLDKENGKARAKTLAEIEEKDAKAYGKDSAVRMYSDLQIQFGNGEVVHQRIEADEAFLSPEEFDMSTMEGFEKGINELDRVMSEYARKLDKAGREFYLNELKKNKNR